jgi:hypothetical protein
MLVAAHFHFLCTGQKVEVHVNAQHAMLEFSKSTHWQRDAAHMPTHLLKLFPFLS